MTACCGFQGPVGSAGPAGGLYLQLHPLAIPFRVPFSSFSKLVLVHCSHLASVIRLATKQSLPQALLTMGLLLQPSASWQDLKQRQSCTLLRSCWYETQDSRAVPSLSSLSPNVQSSAWLLLGIYKVHVKKHITKIEKRKGNSFGVF